MVRDRERGVWIKRKKKGGGGFNSNKSNKALMLLNVCYDYAQE